MMVPHCQPGGQQGLPSSNHRSGISPTIGEQGGGPRTSDAITAPAGTVGVGSVQTPTLTKRPWVQTAHNVHLHFRFTGLGCKTCCHVLEARQHAVLQRQSRPSAPQQRAGHGTRCRPPVGVRIGRAGFKYQGPSGVDQKSPWTSGQDRISRTFCADRTERPVIGDVSQAEKDKRCATLLVCGI